MSHSRPYQNNTTSNRGGFNYTQRGRGRGRGKSLFDRTSFEFDGSNVFNTSSTGGNNNQNGFTKFKKHYNPNHQNKYYKKHFNGNNSFKKNSTNNNVGGQRSFATDTTDSAENEAQFEEIEEDQDEERNELAFTGYSEPTSNTIGTTAALESAISRTSGTRLEETDSGYLQDRLSAIFSDPSSFISSISHNHLSPPPPSTKTSSFSVNNSASSAQNVLSELLQFTADPLSTYTGPSTAESSRRRLAEGFLNMPRESTDGIPAANTAANKTVNGHQSQDLTPRPASGADELRMRAMASMKKNKGDDLIGSPRVGNADATTPVSNGDRDRMNGGNGRQSREATMAAVEHLLAEGRAGSAQNQLVQEHARQQQQQNSTKDTQQDLFPEYIQAQQASANTSRPTLNVRTSDYETNSQQDEKLRSATSTTTGPTGDRSAQSTTATPSTNTTRTSDSGANKAEPPRNHEKGSQQEKQQGRGRSPQREHRGYDSYRTNYSDERVDRREPPHTRQRTPTKGRYDERPSRYDDRRENRYEERIIAERSDDGRGKRYQSPSSLSLARSRDHPIDPLARGHPDDDRYAPLPPPSSDEYERMAVASGRDLRDPYAHYRHPSDAALRERAVYASDTLASYPPYPASRDAGLVAPHIVAAAREAQARDLRDWLELTRYYDPQYRATQLHAYREQLRRIEEEEAFRAAYRPLPPPRDEALLPRTARSSSALAMPPPPPVQRDERLRDRQPLPPQEQLGRAPSRAANRYEDELASPYRDGAATRDRPLKRRLSFEGDSYAQGRPVEKAQRSTYEDTRAPPPASPSFVTRSNEAPPARPPLSDSERKDSGINGDGPPARSFEATPTTARERTSLPPQEELLARSRGGSIPPSHQRRRYDDDQDQRGRPSSRQGDNDGPNSGGSDGRRFGNWNNRSRSPRPFNNKYHKNNHHNKHHNNNHNDGYRHHNNNNNDNSNNREGGRGHWNRRDSDDRRPPFRRPSFDDRRQTNGKRDSFDGGNNYGNNNNGNNQISSPNGFDDRRNNRGFIDDRLADGEILRPRSPMKRKDTRYYVVKSFNHDNVKTAQKDNIWATQEKNEELFREAFEMSRDVILIFSVNKSRAFQGYARMESPPSPQTATPTWSNSLLWKSSAPFTIRWITICEVNFGRIGHLNNKFNENQPVLIGRDGQEIDPETGAELCRVIDDRAGWMASGGR